VLALMKLDLIQIRVRIVLITLRLRKVKRQRPDLNRESLTGPASLAEKPDIFKNLFFNTQGWRNLPRTYMRTGLCDAGKGYFCC